MNENILKALRMLDGAKDTHWTKEGKPSLEMVRALSKDASVTREQLDTAFPNWNRTNVVNGTVEASMKVSTSPAAEAAVQPLPAAVDNSAQIAAEAAMAEQAAADKVDSSDHDVSESVKSNLVDVAEIDLEEALVALDRYLAKFNEEKDSIQKQIDGVNARRDEIVTELEKRKAALGPVDEQRNIMSALEASLKQREEAHKRRLELIGSGVTKEVIDAVMKPVNPVDAARARR